MKKNFLKSTIVVVAVAASSLGAWRAYDAYEVTDNTLLAENIEALSNPGDPGDGQLPRYKNKTKTQTYSETKFEYDTDSNGKKIKIEYKRSCTTLFTYCKYTGKNNDICYERLNGKVTDCDLNWQRQS